VIVKRLSCHSARKHQPETVFLLIHNQWR
jgi:hypothetical protein